MKKSYLLLVAVAVLLLLVLAFASCQRNPVEDESTGLDTTVLETESVKEEETLAPRFDYFEADMSQYVTIDPAVYADIKLTLEADLEITEAELQRYIKVLQFQERGEAETDTMVDEPLEWGDDAYIYYKGYVDGVAFDSGTNMEDKKPTALGLGSSEFVPGFEAGLVGVIPSETSKDNPVHVICRYPSWYKSSSLAGKEVVFEVYVVYAVEHSFPEYNVDFVKNELMYKFKEDFYASDAARLAEFEEYVRDYMETSMKDTVQEATYSALWDYLLERIEFKTLPQMEIDYYYNSYLTEFENYYDYYKTYGADVGTFDEFVRESMGLDKEDGDWQAEMTRAATDNVKYDVVRFAIAQMENMKTINDEELDEEIKYWIEYYGENYQTTVTKAEVLKNLGELNLRRSAMTSKMHEFLLERVTISYGEGSADDNNDVNNDDVTRPDQPQEETTDAEETTSVEDTTAA